MNSKIIENAINVVVDELDYSDDFKNTLKTFVKNKFDDNTTESDLKTVLSFIEIEEGNNK